MLHPEEVEAELRMLEAIKEAAVLGITDKEWGQRVVAVVVPHNGKQTDSSEIKQKLKSRLSSFKIPKQILQVDSLPRNRTGKVIINDLIKLFKA
ncbi:MAG: hypothetical protein U5K69_25520 [Balneolaceae bacterium]|nr:hypothetical protein [Balneolaceae bacterium]